MQQTGPVVTVVQQPQVVTVLPQQQMGTYSNVAENYHAKQATGLGIAQVREGHRSFTASYFFVQTAKYLWKRLKCHISATLRLLTKRT